MFGAIRVHTSGGKAWLFPETERWLNGDCDSKSGPSTNVVFERQSKPEMTIHGDLYYERKRCVCIVEPKSMPKLWRDIGGVTIYRPFGEFRRANSYCPLYGAQGQTTGVLLAPCRDEFCGPRSDYVRQVAFA
ncbi:hypothetical protein TNCV_2962401 [Trichonephila clavipes]|nr:hypothetical protein TNCV_2962401 [Trichonephila clavipes]